MVVHMALAMARPWKHPKTGIYWLRKRVPDDLRPILGKQEEKRSLGTRDFLEAKRLHAQALAELEQRWANLRAPPKAISEREAHELVAPAYDWWFDLHQDNPSQQELWKTKHFDQLWDRRRYLKFADLPLPEKWNREAEEGHTDMFVMEKFCRDRVEELLTSQGLKVDDLSRSKIEKALGAAIQRASLDLAKLARGEFASSLHSQRSISVEQRRPDTEGVTKPVTFGSLMDGWARERRPMQKTIYEYKRALRDLAAFLGHDDATRLSSQNLIAWKAKMIEAGLHPKTILGAKLAPVRAILQWAVDNQPRGACHYRPEDPGG
jgi:hypothetical protein